MVTQHQDWICLFNRTMYFLFALKKTPQKAQITSSHETAVVIKILRKKQYVRVAAHYECISNIMGNPCAVSMQGQRLLRWP